MLLEVKERNPLKVTTRDKGESAELRALAYLEARGLTLIDRNYRVARGPSARGGEIDLIMRDMDETLVFIEVRQRTSGQAAATVNVSKQKRIIRCAQHYLLTWKELPPCRFDVVAIDGDDLTWLKAAFDASA